MCQSFDAGISNMTVLGLSQESGNLDFQFISSFSYCFFRSYFKCFWTTRGINIQFFKKTFRVCMSASSAAT